MLLRNFCLILYAFVGFTCQDRDKIQFKEDSGSVPKQLSNTVLGYLDTLMDDGSSINLRFKPRLDSNLYSVLNKWVSQNEIKISQSDKLMLSRLDQTNFDNKYFSAGDTSFLKGDTIRNIVRLYFGGLSFNSDSTEISTVLSVHFGKDIISGWEEIVIFSKEERDWVIKSKWIIIEY